MPQPLKHANAGVLQTTNMHKARFANVQDAEQWSRYVREEEKTFFQACLAEAFKKKSCTVSPNCSANAIVRPNSLSLKKTN